MTPAELRGKVDDIIWELDGRDPTGWPVKQITDRIIALVVDEAARRLLRQKRVAIAMQQTIGTTWRRAISDARRDVLAMKENS